MILNPGEQGTLAGDAEFRGIGLHTGEPCALVVHGARAGTGIVFRKDGVDIQARPKNIQDTDRGTSLSSQGVRVVCVEHLLSALAGVGVDNAVCEVTGPELPAMDGSAILFVDKFADIGIEKQGRERPQYSCAGVEGVVRGESALVASPSRAFEAHYLLRFGHPLIGISFCRFAGEKEEFVQQVAPARTFGLASEGVELRKRGLALGASSENTLIVFDDHVLPQKRFPDEFVRHKVLDMVGDLALTGGAILGSMLGIATGHWANVEMARRIRKE